MNLSKLTLHQTLREKMTTLLLILSILGVLVACNILTQPPESTIPSPNKSSQIPHSQEVPPSPVPVSPVPKAENENDRDKDGVTDNQDKCSDNTPTENGCPEPSSVVQLPPDRLKDGSLAPQMVFIPAGLFRMGDIQGEGDDNEKPVHQVSINGFAISRTEVTVGEFQRFVDATGYKTEAEKGKGCRVRKIEWDWVKDANWRNPYYSQDNNHPVVCVSWLDATAYTEWLSQQTGTHYRLPTEAEWEYAARAGTETARYWGNNPDEACRYANVHDETSKKENGYFWAHHNCTDGYGKTAPVGSFKPNEFGLFDMLGNVWEWTCSKYESQFRGEEKRCLSKNNNNNSSLRVLRGGAWNNEPLNVRVTTRYNYSGDDSLDFVGIRLAKP